MRCATPRPTIWREMPFNIGGPEAMFILVIVLIVFGAGKLPEVFGQLGKGVRAFRDESTSSESTVVTPSARPTCAKCSAPLPDGAKFCATCGTAV
jgi:sec-independent protein translocase protein TatA